MRCAVLLFLACCGRPTQIAFASVDPAWRADLDALAEGLGGLVSVGEGPYVLVAERQPDKTWGGHAQGFVLSILPYEEIGAKFGPTMRRTVLAHELGHLLGLQHAHHGIMRASPTSECIGREAECVLEALNERPPVCTAMDQSLVQARR